MIDRVISYEEFCKERVKYNGKTFVCFVQGCNKEAWYEGGDARFYCCMCEEHAGIKESYIDHLKRLRFKIKTRLTWCNIGREKNKKLLEDIETKLAAIVKEKENA